MSELGRPRLQTARPFRRGVAIGVAVIVAVLAPSQVGAAPIAAPLLRYHFVAGQTLTYQLTGSAQASGTLAGSPATNDLSLTTYQVHYQFGKVAPSGEAPLALLIDHASLRETAGGKTTMKVLPAGTTNWIQAPNGEQYTTDRRVQGAYSNGNLGLVPGRPVPLKGSWVATLANDIGIKGRQLSCTNVLRSLSGVTATGNPLSGIATVATTCAIAGPNIGTDGGKRYKLWATETLGGLWQFNIAAGRFLAQQQYETLSASGTVSDATGTHAYTFSLKQAITMRLLSVQD